MRNRDQSPQRGFEFRGGHLPNALTGPRHLTQRTGVAGSTCQFAGVRYENRTSNHPFRDYDTTILSVSARLTF